MLAYPKRSETRKQEGMASDNRLAFRFFHPCLNPWSHQRRTEKPSHQTPIRHPSMDSGKNSGGRSTGIWLRILGYKDITRLTKAWRWFALPIMLIGASLDSCNNSCNTIEVGVRARSRLSDVFEVTILSLSDLQEKQGISDVLRTDYLQILALEKSQVLPRIRGTELSISVIIKRLVTREISLQDVFIVLNTLKLWRRITKGLYRICTGDKSCPCQSVTSSGKILITSWIDGEVKSKGEERRESVADDQCSLLEVGKPSADGEIISRSVGISSDKIYKQPPRVLQHHQVRHHSSSFSSNISVTHTLYSQPKDSCKLPSKSLLVCEISKQ